MSFWKDKKVLITGGNGFVGSHMVERLVQEGAKVTSTLCGLQKNLNEAYMNTVTQYPGWADMRIMPGNLKEMEYCMRVTKDQDVVMHLAALVGGIQYNSTHPATLFRENLSAYMNVLEAARQNNAERFLTVSSACVYPRNASIPTPEEEGFNEWPEPTNEGYGMSKRMEEYLARKYFEEYGMKIAIARPYNTYGPRDKFDPEVSHVIPGLIKRVVGGENPLKVWGTGEQTRSFIYVSDFVEGLMLTAEKYCVADALNIGTSEEVKIKDLIAMIIAAAGTDTKIEFDTSKLEGQPRRTCDTKKAYEKIGFEAKVSLREGLEKTIGWYIQHGKD